LIEQFAGFFNLEDVDLGQYSDRTKPMDVVLGQERTRQTQIAKQADVVALLALLPQEVDRQIAATNFRYYEPRCDHASSLSRAAHAIVAARLGDPNLALRYFKEIATTDLCEPPARSGGGVHAAAQGGLWQTVVFGFAGLFLLEDVIAFDPHLPASWNSLKFRVQWRGRQIRLCLDHGDNLLSAFLEHGQPMKLLVAGKLRDLFTGQWLKVTR
jgi:trehalose/maltose hydrolase-like predicted phosphorylase